MNFVHATAETIELTVRSLKSVFQVPCTFLTYSVQGVDSCYMGVEFSHVTGWY